MLLVEYVVAPVEGLTIIPDSILSEHAAPLLCGMITAGLLKY